MKLIITGASGYVGMELVRQSLKRPEITTIIALSRKPVSVPSDVGGDSNEARLRSVVIEDYGEYPEDVRKEFKGADACIWYVPYTAEVVPEHFLCPAPNTRLYIVRTEA